MVSSSCKQGGPEKSDQFKVNYNLRKRSSLETMASPDAQTAGPLKSLRVQNFIPSMTLERLNNVVTSDDSLELETSEVFDGLNRVEETLKMQTTPNPDTVGLFDCSNEECELTAERSNVAKKQQLQLVVDAVHINGCELSKALVEPPWPMSVADEKGRKVPRRCTRRSISSSHDKSYHCRADATQVLKEEYPNNLESDGMEKAKGKTLSRAAHDVISPRACTMLEFVKKGTELGTSPRILCSMVTASQLDNTVIIEDIKVSSLQDETDENFVGDQRLQGKEFVTREKVRETLRLFQAICRKLFQEEESKLKKSGERNRVDLRALKLLKEKGKCLRTEKQRIGSISGVEIGDEFHFRAELSLIGLHRNLVSGVDYMKLGGQYIATSIVSCECYANIMEGTDVLIYSGSGGNLAHPSKISGDQKLEAGNLALKNCIDAQIPVRVIHGFKEHTVVDFRHRSKKGITTYIYDGLYLVEKYWSEPGSKGFSIFKFRLRRLPGQPELAIIEVKRLRRLKVRQGLCIDDISQGKEKKPIAAVNTIDHELPMPFNYIRRMIYPSWYKPVPPTGCDCIDGCSDSVKCACAVKNGGEIPFNYDGAIVEAKPLVYECGPSCKCPPSCHNRVSQHGIKFELEIFKTESMGWGVRSLTSIPSGSFVCEYIGEMLEENEAEKRSNDEYLFDIGRNYNDESLWEGLSTFIPDLQNIDSSEAVEDAGFTVDAAMHSNVGRFINHNCTPNLYAQNLLYDHDNKSLPHIALFATENIPPLQELTYHYNYTMDQVRDSDGNIKKKNCYCGSIECTGRLY